MPDRYSSFADLATVEREGIDYRVCVTKRDSEIVIAAPHGGYIERGTSQIAAAIAVNKFSVYCFEGLVPGRPHSDLHISSERFDEPRGIQLVESSKIAIGVHGRKDEGDEETIWLGGLDAHLGDAVRIALEQAGFKVKVRSHRLPGKDPNNICNRGQRKAGVQLEIPRGLRERLMEDASCMHDFGAAVREAIERRIADTS